MKIALFKGTSCISRLIRWQSRSEYSHAALLLSDGTLVEAEPGGVRRTTLAQAYAGSKYDIDIFSIEGLAPDGEKAAEAFALAQVGKPYDYTMVARFVTREQEARESAGKWFCSELVFAALSKAVELFRNTDPWEVSPGLLPRSITLKYSHTVNLPRPQR